VEVTGITKVTEKTTTKAAEVETTEATAATEEDFKEVAEATEEEATTAETDVVEVDVEEEIVAGTKTKENVVDRRTPRPTNVGRAGRRDTSKPIVPRKR